MNDKDLALHDSMIEAYVNRTNDVLSSPAFKELTEDEQKQFVDDAKYLIKREQQRKNELLQAQANADAESAYAEPATLQGQLNRFMEESDPVSRGIVGGAVGFAAPVARGAVKLASMPYARTMQYYNALIGNDAEAKLYKQAEENLNRDFAENYAPRVFQDPSMYDSGTSKTAAYLGNAAEGVRELAAPLGAIGRYAGASKLAKFGLEAAYFALEGANAHTDFIEEKTGKFKPFAGLGDSTVKAVALTAMLGILHNKGMSPDAIRATILDKARSNSLVESVWKYGKDVAADGLKTGLAFAGSDFLGQLADEAQVYTDDKGRYDFNEGIQRLKESSYKGFGQGLLFGVVGSLGKQGNIAKMVKEYGRENILNGHVRDVIFEEVDKTNDKLGKMFGKGNVNEQNRRYASQKILEALDKAGTRLRKEKGVSKTELDSFENYYRDLSRILNGEMGEASAAEGARASQVNRLNKVIEDKSTPLSEKQEAAKQKQDVNTEYGVKLQQEYEASRNQNALVPQGERGMVNTVDERPAIYPEDVDAPIRGQDWTSGETVYGNAPQTPLQLGYDEANTPEMTNRLFRGNVISPESGETIRGDYEPLEAYKDRMRDKALEAHGLYPMVPVEQPQVAGETTPIGGISDVRRTPAINTAKTDRQPSMAIAERPQGNMSFADRLRTDRTSMPSDIGDIKTDTRSKTKQEMVSRPFGWDKAEFGSEPEKKQPAKKPAVKKTSASKVEAKDIPQGIKNALKSDKTVDSASKKALLKGLKDNNIKLVDESVTGNSDLDTFKAGDTYIGLKKNSKLASELKKNIGETEQQLPAKKESIYQRFDVEKSDDYFDKQAVEAINTLKQSLKEAGAKFKVPPMISEKSLKDISNNYTKQEAIDYQIDSVKALVDILKKGEGKGRGLTEWFNALQLRYDAFKNYLGETKSFEINRYKTLPQFEDILKKLTNKKARLEKEEASNNRQIDNKKYGIWDKNQESLRAFNVDKKQPAVKIDSSYVKNEADNFVSNNSWAFQASDKSRLPDVGNAKEFVGSTRRLFDVEPDRDNPVGIPNFKIDIKAEKKNDIVSQMVVFNNGGAFLLRDLGDKFDILALNEKGMPKDYITETPLVLNAGYVAELSGLLGEDAKIMSGQNKNNKPVLIEGKNGKGVIMPMSNLNGLSRVALAEYAEKNGAVSGELSKSSKKFFDSVKAFKDDNRILDIKIRGIDYILRHKNDNPYYGKAEYELGRPNGLSEKNLLEKRNFFDKNEAIAYLVENARDIDDISVRNNTTSPDGTDGKSKFSKDLQNSEGFVPVKKAQMSVDEIKSQIAKDYPQLNGVDFTVVENGDMFPDAEGIARENGVDSVSDLALNAVQVGNKVYINAERMDTPEKVAMTVYHEAIEHIGFEKFIGEKPLDDLRKAILEEAEDDKELKELKKRTLEEDSNTEKDSKLLADEMMGRIAGDIPKKGKGVWEKIKKAFDKVKSLFIRKLYKMGWLKNISAKEAVKWIAELIAKRGIKPDDRPDGTYDNIIKGVKKSGKSIENIKKTKVRKSSGSDLYLAGTRELIYNRDLQSSILSDSNDSGVRKTKKFGIVMNSGKYHAYVRNPDYTYDVFDGFDTPEEALNALKKEADYYGIDRNRIRDGKFISSLRSKQSMDSKNNGSSAIRRRSAESGILDSEHNGQRTQDSDNRGNRRTQEGNPEGKKKEKRRFSSEGRIKKINLEAEHKKYVDSMKSPETYDQIRIQSAKGKFNLGKAARKNEYYRGIRQGFDDMKKQLRKTVQSGRKEAVTEFRQNIRQLNDYAQKFVKNKGDLARLERVISENASTPAGYAKAIRTMEELVDTRLRRDELSDFRSLMKEIRKRPLHSVIKKDIGNFLGEELTDEDVQGLMKGQGFHAAGLAKIRTTAENLRKVIAKLSKNAELDEIDVPEFIKDFAKINDVDKFLLDSKGSELDNWIKETIQEQVPAAKVSPEQLAKVNCILHHFLTAQDAIEKSLSGYYMEEAQKTADKIASELPPSKATPEKDYEAGLIRRSLMPVGAYNSLDGENFTELMGETGKKVFHTDMVDGYEKMQHYQRQGYQVIDELREGYGDNWRSKLDKSIGTVRSTDGKRISITRGEAMALVATAMDTDTAKLISGGRNQFVLGRKRNGSPIIFTMKQIQAVSDALDSRDLEAVRKIMDMIATYKPLINATKEEISGFESISRDNYFPRFSTRTAKDSSIFNSISAPFKSDVTNAEWVGIAKHRENGGESFIIRDIFDVAEHYIDQASLYSGMAVPARAADRLLRNPKFAGSVSNSLGTDYLNILKHRISAYAGMAGKTNETTITNAIRKLVGRTAGSKLTPFSALKQLTTVHLASPIIKHRYLAQGWKDINNPEVEKRMMDTDLGYLRYRDTALASLIDSGNKTFADARDFARSQINTNKYSPFKWFAELSTKFDKKALTVIFRGAELQAKAEGKGAERAEELFKKAVYQTQNTTDVMNANGFQIDAKNSFWSAMLNMYLNQQQKAGNMVYRLARNISKAKGTGAKKEAVIAAGSYVASMLAATWLGFAIDDSRRKLLGRDIKENEKERLRQRRNQKLLEQGKPIPEESGKARKGLSLLYKYAEANMGNPILKQLTDGLDAVLDNKKSRHNTGGVFGVSDVIGAVTSMQEVIDQEIERYNEDTATPVQKKMMKTVESALTSKTAGLFMDSIGIQSWIPRWIAEAYKNYKVIPEEIQQKKQKEAVEDAKHQASKQKRADREVRNRSKKWNSYGSNWGNPSWNKKSKKSVR